MLRRALRAAISTPAAAWAASLLERSTEGASPTCAILTYHRVLDPETNLTTYPGLCVRPAELEAQLAEIVRRYEVIGLDALLSARRGEASLPRRSVLLTFDDAYTDFAANAWPILTGMSLPAVVFVPTDFAARPDLAFWWERLYELVVLAGPRGVIDTPIGPLRVHSPRTRRAAFGRLRSYVKAEGEGEVRAILAQLESAVDAPPARGHALGWGELRQLAAAGATLAPHSKTHRLLPQLDDSTLRMELEEPRMDLEREIGASPPAVAYPSGAHDARVRKAARSAGYELAFTTRRGIHRPDRHAWLAIRRINVGLGAHPRLVAAQIAALSASSALS
jgi:peptidoglycan/xylan/chitin deacetylase (PgdA/CDA1 family)